MENSDEDPLNEFLQKFLGSLERSACSSGTKSPDSQLREIFDRPDFRALVHLYSVVSEYRLKEPGVIDCDSLNLVSDVSVAVREKPFLPEVQELLHIVNRPHIQALLTAHDQVSTRQYEPRLPDIPYEVDEDDGLAVKIVRLVKNSEPLGATIKVEEAAGAVIVARVMHGGVADRSGCIHVGDRVLEVNNIPITGRTPSEIVKILGSSTNGTVTFKLIPGDDPNARQPRESKTRMRALFTYDPHQDPLIPCAEAGLPFKVGDILHIVSQDDPNWWQATVESPFGSPESGLQQEKAGLIPSKKLQEKVASLHPDSRRGSVESGSLTGGLKKGLGSSHQSSIGSGIGKRVRKIMYETRSSEDFENEEVKTYEEVARLFPMAGIYRPIVLIGPPGVGRNELKRRLLLLDPNHYASSVPHTSREKRNGEMEGVEYHFVSRDQMDLWISQGRFIEYGEYKGNLYGTLIDSVKAVVNSGRVCVLNPHPQALRLLRTAEIKPFVVLVKPPPFTTLKATRETFKAKSTFDGSYTRGFSDEELETMIGAAKRLELNFGHTVDYTLVNGSIDTAFRELCDVVHNLQNEPQWVPSSWVR